MLDKATSFWQLLDICWTSFCNNHLLINSLYKVFLHPTF